uniref:Uncharacterized protein n=1 Tax=Xiphophorus couchianus TaxID=32473 RepID=A0A3B5MVJ1_9TELE
VSCGNIPLLCTPLYFSAVRSTKRTLQPWLIGVSAAVGFLVIVFILLIGKKLLSIKRFVNHSYFFSNTDGVALYSVSLRLLKNHALMLEGCLETEEKRGYELTQKLDLDVYETNL